MAGRHFGLPTLPPDMICTFPTTKATNTSTSPPLPLATATSLQITAYTTSPTDLPAGGGLQLLDMPSGWSVDVASASSPGWKASGSGTTVTFTSNSALPNVTASNSILLTIVVTPPATCSELSTTINAQLVDASGTAISNPCSLTLNLTLPDMPIIAYPSGSGAVILGPTGAPVTNDIACVLRNTTSSVQTIESIVATFRLIPRSGTGPISLANQGVKDATFTVDPPAALQAFTADTTTLNWTSPGGTLAANGEAVVRIGKITLSSPELHLLAVDLTVSVSGRQPYPTSAYFNVLGPYHIGVQLDPHDQPGFVVDADTSPSTGDPTPPTCRVRGLTPTPELNWTLLDADNQPVGLESAMGFFSATNQSPDPNAAVTDAPLKQGSNSMYWCTEAGGKAYAVMSGNVDLEVITDATPSSQKTPLNLSNIKVTTVGHFDGWTNLQYANFAGAILNGVDFRGRDLTGANFTRADLTGADLTDAILKDANLTDANLTDATLTGVTSGGITGAPTTVWAVNGFLLGPGAHLEGMPAASLFQQWFPAAYPNTPTTRDLTGANLKGWSNTQIVWLAESGANLSGALALTPPLVIEYFYSQLSKTTPIRQVTVKAPPGYKILSMGAYTGSVSNYLQSIYPVTNQQWIAEFLSASNNPQQHPTVSGVALFDPNDLWDVQISAPGTTIANVPDGYALVGGGVRSASPGFWWSLFHPQKPLLGKLPNSWKVAGTQTTTYAIGLKPHAGSNWLLKEMSVYTGGGGGDAPANYLLQLTDVQASITPPNGVPLCGGGIGWTKLDLKTENSLYALCLKLSKNQNYQPNLAWFTGAMTVSGQVLVVDGAIVLGGDNDQGWRDWSNPPSTPPYSFITTS